MSRKQLLNVVAWAAEECERQRSGERSVDWMVQGWEYAMQRRDRVPSRRFVVALGAIVEPRHNDGIGYRTVGVRVGMSVKPPASEVEALMKRLLTFAWVPKQTGDADQWFRDYEEIHPFRDGNGRTGSILWNWLRGSLAEPVEPPDFWGADVEVPQPADEFVASLRRRMLTGML